MALGNIVFINQLMASGKMEAEMSELKACPMCGREAHIIGENIECKYCGCTSISIDGVNNNAVEQWNTRPIEDALRARIDTMQKYIDALENEPVRSMSVIKRLRTQTGMDTDYSHDWRWAGMLLEELPTDIRMQCMIGNTDEIRMRIAEAWLAWKEGMG